MRSRVARRRRRWVAGVVATGVIPALLVVGLAGADGDPASPADPVVSAPPASASVAPTPSASVAPTPSASATASTMPRDGEALAVLESLPVKGRAPKTGYDRDQFGPAWADVDGNGCDTRNDILRRDLTEVTIEADGCTVRSGLLADPYSRDWIRFTRGPDTSSLVQVDHVVSLSDAWQKGAQQLTPTQRQRFANDPLNLLAVDGGLNMRKSDGDAATWLPPNKSFRCEMVARQVAVKARHDLWVTQAEKDAIGRVLASCPGQPLPRERAAPRVTPDGPVPAQPRASSPRPSAATGPPGAAFATCAAAREAGAAPVYRGDPGYGPHLDRDADGVGCE